MMVRGIVPKRTSQRIVSAWVATALLCLPCSPLLAQTWEIEVLDNGKQFSNMTDRSLRLDAQGHPHIAYGEDWLYYAWFDGSAWQYEVADSSSGMGEFASLALDPTGYPHISHGADYPNYDLKHAYRDATGWHAEIVDSLGGSYTSMALDGAGYPHISYHAGGLKYAHEDAAGWHVETVHSGHAGWYTSMALDGAGYPHISYATWGEGWAGCYHYTYADDLKCAYKDDAGWHVETVDLQGNVGYCTSLTLDVSGYPHISYCDDTNHDLKYAYEDAAGWHVEIVDSEGYAGYHTSLALDTTGNPYVSYKDGSNANLKYAHKDGAGWHLQTVDAEGSVGSWTSLALDGSEHPHISYYDATNLSLKCTYHDAAGWHAQSVDAERDAGVYASLVVDTSGDPHVAYYVDDVLRCLVQDDELANGWMVDPAAPPADVSLAMDSDGYHHLSYQDQYPTLLKYAFEDNTGWYVETVDGQLDCGLYNSLALDTAGYPHISYFDNANDDLKYAYRDEAGWHRLTVDSQGQTGSHTSLALDASDYPHIGYCDGTNDNLRYAYEDATGWHFQTLDSLVNLNAASLALDENGYAHFGYCVTYPAYCVKHAYEDAMGWHREIVGTQPYTLFYDASLALDGSGYPHLSYYVSGDSYDLKYAYKDETGWHRQTVDAGGHVGRYCSLGLDSPGRAHIAYYDYTLKDLKYARMVSPPVVAGSTVLAAGPVLPVQLTALAVWPNPASQVVHARLAGVEGRGMVKLTVVDLLGRRVMSLQQPEATSHEGAITLRLPESIPTGQYFLGVEGEDYRRFVPITVVK